MCRIHATMLSVWLLIVVGGSFAQAQSGSPAPAAPCHQDAGAATAAPARTDVPAGSNTSAGVSAEQAKSAFERIKKLAGRWQGQSTKGWEDKSKYEVIAAESVVMHTSFDAHPGEQMVTMFHLDGDRLLLTHYCVAKNQPRLQATSVEDDGRLITFTFLDATNLPSRNKGHMDKCVLRFLDDDHFTSRWTWYQDGKEGWMEEIVNERMK